MIVLTEKSRDVLAGRTQVELIKVVEQEKKRSRSSSADVASPVIQELFDELRQVRTAFAKAENVPPYVVFSDATLVEMAAYLPQNDREMHSISGVGDLKFEKYGSDFLRVVREYCAKHNLASRMALKSPKRERRQRTKRDENGMDTYAISLEMFRGGRSVADIARERGIQPSTVENHLARFISTGQIALDELVPTHKVEPIRKAVIRFNDAGALSPIKEFLGDGYTYGEIRAVIASM